MNGMTVFASLQYVDDALLEEAEVPVRRGSPWLRWGAIAACLALLAGAGLVWPMPQMIRTYLSQPINHGPAVYLSPQPSGYVNLPAVQTTVQPAPGAAQGGIRPDPKETHAPVPGGVPGTPGDLGPYMEQPAEPEVFAWVEQLPMPYTGPDDNVHGEVILVGQELAPEQAAACTPEVRLEWMEDFSGSATYKLADGSGGLSCVELWVTHEDLGNTCRVTLREATPERLAA